METLTFDELKALLQDAYEAGEKKIGFENYFEELRVRAGKQAHLISSKPFVSGSVCGYHNLEFIGDGIWKCKKCGLEKTNNVPQTDR